MKKAFLFAISFAALTCIANVRRVGFSGFHIVGVDYATLQVAHDSSASGDTIYMFPNSYMNCSVSKKLFIFGPGYFLDSINGGNGSLQANINTTTSNGPFELLSGSNGTEVYGCNFDHMIYFNGTTGHIIIKRCRIGGRFCYYYCGPSGAVDFYASCADVFFQQCVILNSITVRNPGINVSNLSFSNCIFGFPNVAYQAGLLFDNANSIVSGVIENCVFTSTIGSFPMTNGLWMIRNCISQQSNGFSGDNISYSNDIGTGSQFPSGNGNLQNQTWGNIFVPAGSADGQYKLNTSGPAAGAGVGGTDCGIFGGPNPYRLSGIPPIPAIYSLYSPQGTSPSGNTMQINVSARSNN